MNCTKHCVTIFNILNDNSMCHNIINAISVFCECFFVNTKSTFYTALNTCINTVFVSKIWKNTSTFFNNTFTFNERFNSVFPKNVSRIKTIKKWYDSYGRWINTKNNNITSCSRLHKENLKRSLYESSLFWYWWH